MKDDVLWAISKVEGCRTAAYFAKNKRFSDFWNKIADELEATYLDGQPWLRTYDGTVE